MRIRLEGEFTKEEIIHALTETLYQFHYYGVTRFKNGDMKLDLLDDHGQDVGLLKNGEPFDIITLKNKQQEEQKTHLRLIKCEDYGKRSLEDEGQLFRHD